MNIPKNRDCIGTKAVPANDWTPGREFLDWLATGETGWRLSQLVSENSRVSKWKMVYSGSPVTKRLLQYIRTLAWPLMVSITVNDLAESWTFRKDDAPADTDNDWTEIQLDVRTLPLDGQDVDWKDFDQDGSPEFSSGTFSLDPDQVFLRAGGGFKFAQNVVKWRARK